jgi:hypothetical protein
MKNLSFYKRWKVFQEYKKILRRNKIELQERFGVRIDRAWRMYNVLNVPVESFGEAYNTKKSDIDKISENFIREYSIAFREFLDSKGLKELYDYYSINKVEKYSYLLIIGFSLIRTNEYYDLLIKRVLPISSALLIILGLILFI